MIDEATYVKVVNTCTAFINNNAMQLGGQQFLNLFISNHDLRNYNQNQRFVEGLRRFVTTALQRNNGNLNDHQLYMLCGQYVEEFYKLVLQQQQQQMQGGNMMGGGFGGGMGMGGMTPGGVFPNMGGGSGYSPGGHLVTGGTNTPTPMPTNRQQPQQRGPELTMPSFSTANLRENPLEEMDKSDSSFGEIARDPNWGVEVPATNPFVFLNKTEVITSDRRFSVKKSILYLRAYTPNPMDVVRKFFDTAPEQFLADFFVAKINYNHIERIHVPTEEFLSVRHQFSNTLTNEPKIRPYDAIIRILDKMQFSSRKAIVTYLTNLINRTLHIYFGRAEKPESRINFDEIEDMDKLLGISFDHPTLHVPGAREIIVDLINRTIINALTVYSDIMFHDKTSPDIDIIRTSEYFPYSIPGVYGNKSMIPRSGSPDAEKFYDAMYEKELSQYTYVRSIRSIIVTNTFGPNVLGKFTDASAPGTYLPKAVNTRLAGIFNRLIPRYDMQFDHKNVCRRFDVGMGGNAVNDYEQYLKFADGDYEMNIFSLFQDQKDCDIPVDQKVFAVQYKTDPREYLMALDLCTVLDNPDTEKNLYLARAKISEIVVRT